MLSKMQSGCTVTQSKEKPPGHHCYNASTYISAYDPKPTVNTRTKIYELMTLWASYISAPPDILCKELCKV